MIDRPDADMIRLAAERGTVIVIRSGRRIPVKLIGWASLGGKARIEYGTGNRCTVSKAELHLPGEGEVAP